MQISFPSLTDFRHVVKIDISTYELFYINRETYFCEICKFLLIFAGRAQSMNYYFRPIFPFTANHQNTFKLFPQISTNKLFAQYCILFFQNTQIFCWVH